MRRFPRGTIRNFPDTVCLADGACSSRKGAKVGRIKRFSRGSLLATSIAGSTFALGAAATLGAGPAAAYGPSQGSGGGTTTTTAPKAAPAHHALAFTGADVMITTAGGAAAIGLGGMAVLAARKKRAKPTERVEQ